MPDEATARPDLPPALLAVRICTAALLGGTSGLLATLPRAFTRSQDMTAATAADAAHLDYVLRIADSALILGQRLADQHRAGSHRPGAAAADPRRPTRGPGPRRGRARLPARRARVPEPHDLRAAERGLRPHVPAQLPVRRLPDAAVAGAGGLDRRAAGGDRRQEHQGNALPPEPRRRLDRAAGRRQSARRGRLWPAHGRSRWCRCWRWRR